MVRRRPDQEPQRDEVDLRCSARRPGKRKRDLGRSPGRLDPQRQLGRATLRGAAEARPVRPARDGGRDHRSSRLRRQRRRAGRRLRRLARRNLRAPEGRLDGRSGSCVEERPDRRPGRIDVVRRTCGCDRKPEAEGAVRRRARVLRPLRQELVRFLRRDLPRPGRDGSGSQEPAALPKGAPGLRDLRPDRGQRTRGARQLGADVDRAAARQLHAYGLRRREAGGLQLRR